MATKKKSSSNDSWGDWGNHVLAELVRLNKNFESMQENNSKMWIEISMLKVKSGLWGVVGGSLAVLPTLFYFWMKQGI
jgi:hypothetical protein